MAAKKRLPASRPPIRANPPPKGQWSKQISAFMKRLQPPKTGGRKK